MSKQAFPKSGPKSVGKPGAKPEQVKRRPKSKPSAKAPTQRQLRVSEEIRHVLSSLFFRGEFRDPDLAGAKITVTEVRISPDLKNATAFVARLGRSDVEVLLPALKRAAPYFRMQLSHEMRLRVAPQVSFQPDTTLEYAMHVDSLLRAPEVARDLAPTVPPTDTDR